MRDIPLKHVIGWGLTVMIAVSGGTFALTKYGNEQIVETLKQRISIEEQKRNDAENRITELSMSKNVTTIPSKEIDAKLDSPEISELASRIEKLEIEKQNLIVELSKKSVSSLDPRSELSGLINQLESNEKEIRGKAVNSLFELKDLVSFEPLIRYFQKYPDETTEGHNPSIRQWYDFFINTNESAGIEFVIGQLENDYRIYSGVAFSTLDWNLDNVNRIEEAKPHLKDMALRSNNNSARAYAKILLKKIQNRKEKIIKQQKDNEDSLKNEKTIIRELLEEILKEVKGLKNNDDEPANAEDN